MTIATKLGKIQQALKAPKDLRNDFGGFNYRSNESILQGLKPILDKYQCIIVQSDELVATGDRIHVKATSTITDCETGESISASAFAREPLTKKGMDDSQLTGSTSSYARKYSLNGLFLIDDNKDADTNQFNRQSNSPQPSDAHDEFKAKAEAILKANAEAIAADPQLKQYVDACLADGFYKDCYNNLYKKFGGKQ